jgi:hypothetical protein
MAETNPNGSERLLKITRRDVLSSVAGTTAASLAPNLTPSETEPIVLTQTVSTASETILNVCATTSRRLLEIQRRNELRRESKLPTLPIAKTLRVMKETEDSEKFSEGFGLFAATNRQVVWDEVLKSRRESEGPNWRPNWIEGIAYQSEVFRILRERFRAER